MMRRVGRVRSGGAGARLSVLALVAFVLVGAPTSVHAHSYTLGKIAIGHVWAPPAAGTGASAGAPVYGPLLNRGDAPARLVGASTPLAERVRFRVVDQDGRVRWPKAIELPPGKPIALASWRAHLWLVGLRQPLHEGDSFDLTLDFADAGKIAVKVMVERTPSD
jgi:copper(I)-binding protein